MKTFLGIGSSSYRNKSISSVNCWETKFRFSFEFARVESARATSGRSAVGFVPRAFQARARSLGTRLSSAKQNGGKTYAGVWTGIRYISHNAGVTTGLEVPSGANNIHLV